MNRPDTSPTPVEYPTHTVGLAWRRGRRAVLTTTTAFVATCVGPLVVIGVLARQRAELVRAQGCGSAAECSETFYAFGTGPIQSLLILGTGLELFLPLLPLLAAVAGLVLGLVLVAPRDNEEPAAERRRVLGELVVAAAALTGACLLLGLAGLWAYLPYLSFRDGLDLTSDAVEVLPTLPLITIVAPFVGAGGPLLLRRLRAGR